MPKIKPTHISPTPEEELEINKGIALDPDAPELDDDWFARARPAAEVHPSWSNIPLESAVSKRLR